MRRVALLLPLLFACREEDPVTLPPRPAIRWGTVEFRDLLIQMPEGWNRDAVKTGDYEVHVFGIEDDGWRPELAFGWAPTDNDPQGWVDRKASGAAHPYETVYQRGDCTVAGMPGKLVVVGYERELNGKRIEMRLISFFFGGHGHIGFVRGTSTVRSYMDTYRELFTEAAQRVRYKPQNR